MDKQISFFDDTETEEKPGVDLSVLTDSELIALRGKLEEEIAARKLGKSAVVMRGEYRVGEDIPAGTYHVIGTSGGSEFVVHDRRIRLKYHMICYKKDGIGKVTLADGDTLRNNETITLVVYTGTPVNFV